MRHFANLITKTGDFLMKLSDGARKALVFGLMLLLFSGAVYKLIVSLENLKKPLPALSPEQLIEPMEQIFQQTKNNVSQYQQARQQNMRHLDSLAKQYATKKAPHRP